MPEFIVLIKKKKKACLTKSGTLYYFYTFFNLFN